MQRRFHFLSALAGGVIAALVVSALPAIAQDAEDRASPGDPFLLGVTNLVNERTVLRGNAGSGRSNLVVRNTDGAPPLALLTGGGPQPPLAVDSRGKVRRLNADLLDSRHANGLIRANFGSTEDAANANDDAVSTEITTPQRGILVMGGSIDAIGSTNDLWDCRLSVNGALVPGTIRNTRVNSEGGSHTRNDEEDCSTDGGLVVERGTYTVSLTIRNRNTANFDNATVWVIWSPFNGDGKVPSGVDDPVSEPVERGDSEERTATE